MIKDNVKCPECDYEMDMVWIEVEKKYYEIPVVVGELEGDCDNIYLMKDNTDYTVQSHTKVTEEYAVCKNCDTKFEIDADKGIILFDKPIKLGKRTENLNLGYEEQMISQFIAEAKRLNDWETAMFNVGGLFADVKHSIKSEKTVVDFYKKQPKLFDYIKIGISDDIVNQIDTGIGLLIEGLFQYHHYLLFQVASDNDLLDLGKKEINVNKKCQICGFNAPFITEDENKKTGDVCDFCDKWVCQDCLDKELSGECGDNVCTECAQKINELEEDIQDIYSAIFNEQPNQDLVLDVADEIVQNYKVEDWTKSVAKSTLINTIKDIVGDKY